MFIDASPKYTDTTVNYNKENPIVVELLMKTERNITDYTRTVIITDIASTQITDYSCMAKKRKTTPEHLKKAMFKTSSRGIAAALRK